ncbi:putative opioid growth factor receptor-like protein 1 [Sesbania bispinosa]|nr:putative opioid growth factor receptor-like protein 1 [Sesbania bispinosa]
MSARILQNIKRKSVTVYDGGKDRVQCRSKTLIKSDRKRKKKLRREREDKTERKRGTIKRKGKEDLREISGQVGVEKEIKKILIVKENKVSKEIMSK